MNLNQFSVTLFLFLLLTTPLPAMAATDAEASTHGDDASRYQVVDTYEQNGYKVIQVNLPVLSHYSYVVISDGDAVIVDPGRDISFYQELASEHNFTWQAVLLTHSHADFIAGHLEMKNLTGIPIYVSHLTKPGFEHQPVKDGDLIEIKKMRFKVVETPGHTPDSTTYLVSSSLSPERDDLAFTGDTLFIGSVGRPDLIGGGYTPAKLAGLLYDVWQQKMSRWPDHLQIFPAHGAGSLCGAHLSDAPTSTWGEQKLTNPYLQTTNRSSFITKVIDGLPPAPQYFTHNAQINHDGPALIDWNAPLRSERQVSSDLTDKNRYYVVDLRDAIQYADGHVPNAVNIGLRGRFETWTGIMVPWDASLVLAVDTLDEAREALHRLHRIGYHADWFTMENWHKAGLPVKTNNKLEPRALYDQMSAGNAPLIVDVRLPAEWMALRIGDVVNMPLNRLMDEGRRLDPAEPVVAVCNSAYRSSMALGILERAGIQQATSLAGGGEAWANAGLPVFGAEAMSGKSVVSSAASRRVLLPERLSAEALNRMIQDLPGSFDLVDIRPADKFTDYSIPGSRNVDIAELVYNPAWLVGAGPLIIVDRDGSLAMIVAGIVSQKTQRPIKALHGGVEGWWKLQGPLGSSASPQMIPANPSSSPRPMLNPTPIPSSPGPAIPVQPAPAQPKKKKSAGC